MLTILEFFSRIWLELIGRVLTTSTLPNTGSRRARHCRFWEAYPQPDEHLHGHPHYQTLVLAYSASASVKTTLSSASTSTDSHILQRTLNMRPANRAIPAAGRPIHPEVRALHSSPAVSGPLQTGHSVSSTIRVVDSPCVMVLQSVRPAHKTQP
jgi:hypothetical protein